MPNSTYPDPDLPLPFQVSVRLELGTGQCTKLPVGAIHNTAEVIRGNKKQIHFSVILIWNIAFRIKGTL